MKETLKIRHYLISQVYQNGNISKKIMSSRDMAKHFNVSRSTVSLVLKHLVEQKFIISKPGIGNFTNPLAMQVASPKIIGIIYSGGNNLYISSDIWNNLSIIGNELVKSNYDFRFIQFESEDPKDYYKEIESVFVDGYIWVEYNNLTDNVAKLIADTSVPVVTNTPFISSLNSVCFDYEKMAEIAGRSFADCDVEYLLFGKSNVFSSEYVKHIEDAYSASGKTLDVEILDFTDHQIHQKLSRYFASKKGQFGIIMEVNGSFLPLINNFAQKKELDFIVLNKSQFINKDKKVMRREMSYQQLTESMLKRLKEILAGDKSIKNIVLPLSEK